MNPDNIILLFTILNTFMLMWILSDVIDIKIKNGKK